MYILPAYVPMSESLSQFYNNYNNTKVIIILVSYIIFLETYGSEMSDVIVIMISCTPVDRACLKCISSFPLFYSCATN